MPKVAEEPGEIPSEFMQCRAFRRHSEAIVNDSVVQQRGKVVEFTRHVKCLRCGYESWVTYSVPEWNVLGRKTYYPDFYQMKGGLKGPDAKQEYIGRLGYKTARRESS